MRFCPKCEDRLRKNGDASVCPKCGYTESAARGPTKAKPAEGTPEINVLDGPVDEKLLSTIKIECEKCGHGEAVWWMLQTRSADEPTTQFYRCIKCSHTWRSYA
ncbi:DNA-directed RNA polymerase, subunit M/Transcription elongation factor TFIIS [Cenarchaeum symbiosum A]|uniref:DNA-directed RNA polymerase, subunit M/Transcription elongation factor TFIIS n=1 Tax=Cenarchaeum symbiosum (strain A) TaxID=414004 RepID=A0RXH6_CENSY|nr:DNA-directed RNA polymerase, subunit M/Transcription elongation factor TFIIS [Cenarchaeum symbiosum A]